MRSVIFMLLIAAALAFAATRLMEPGGGPDAQTATGMAYTAAARTELRSVATAQQTHRQTSGGYARSTDALGVASGSSVRIRILDATADGWAAEATAPRSPDASCVIYQGSVPPPTTAGGQRAERPGVPVCD